MASHIVYQVINGIEYVRLTTSARAGDKVVSQAKTLGKDTSLNHASAFQLLMNQKCKVFANIIIPQEAVRKVNDLYRMFGLKSPQTISKKS